MYGLPENFDGSFFVGRILEMICFNSNQVYLHFDDQTTIMIEGSFSHRHAGSGENPGIVNVPVKRSDLMELMGHKVVAVSADRDGTLTLDFDGDQIFTCYDQSPNYESYQIKRGAKVIIV